MSHAQAVSQSVAKGPHHAVKIVARKPCQLSYPGVDRFGDIVCEDHGQTLAVFHNGDSICLSCLEETVQMIPPDVGIYGAFDGFLDPVSRGVWKGRVLPAAAHHSRSENAESMTRRHLMLAAMLHGHEFDALVNLIRNGRGQEVIAMMYNH